MPLLQPFMLGQIKRGLGQALCCFMQAPAQAPALPRAATMHAAVAEAQAALSALHANTAKGLASALNGKALGGIINGTAAVLSGSLPADTIMAVVEAGRNSTVRLHVQFEYIPNCAQNAQCLRLLIFVI